MNKQAIKSAFMDSPEIVGLMDDSADRQDAFLRSLKAVFKGETGYTPQKGVDYFTPEEIKSFKSEILKGATPVKFKDYFTEQEILYIMGEIRKLLHSDLRDGLKAELTPVKGRDYRDGKDGKDADTKTVVNEVLKLVPKHEEISAQNIASKLNTLKEAIETSAIKGLPTIESIVKEIKKKKLIDKKDITGLPINMNDMRWHGGGLSTVSHDTTLTGDGTPTSPLSVVATGAITILTATGAVDDANTAFTFISKPTIIFMNGMGYRDGSKVGGVTAWTWNAGTLTATMFSPVGTGGDIYGI